MLKSLLRVAAVGAALAIFAPLHAATPLPAQTTEQSAVAVKVTPRSMSGPFWDFEVTFDTHTQELKDDLLQSATLVTADGAPARPVDWKGDAPGGHHRKGVLRFDAPKNAAGPLVLRIQRPGEAAARTFRWQLP